MSDIVALCVCILLVLGAASLILAAAWWRMYALVFVGAILAALVGIGMGRPVPVLLAGAAPNGRLLGFAEAPGVALYVWVQPKHGGMPVAVSIPWDDRTADALEKAEAAKCSGKGSDVSFSRGRGGSHAGTGSAGGDDPPLTITEAPMPQPAPKE